MNCGFPVCKQTSPEDVTGDWWCDKHQNVKCVFPPCQDTVRPQSSFCQLHNDWAIFVQWSFAQMQQATMRQAQYNKVIQQVVGGATGRRQ